MAILPVDRLIQLAASGPRHALPTETYQALPVPVHHPDGMRLAFLFCPCLSRKVDLYFYPPDYVAWLTAATGKLEEMKHVPPAELGQSPPPEQLIGRYEAVVGLSPEEYDSRLASLYAAYDEMLPVFAAQPSGIPADVRTAARFKERYDRLFESALLPYLRVLGKDFFAWLDRAAR